MKSSLVCSERTIQQEQIPEMMISATKGQITAVREEQRPMDFMKLLLSPLNLCGNSQN